MRPLLTTRSRLGASVVLLAVSVSGCGGDDPGAVETSTSPQPSSEAPPEEPSAEPATTDPQARKALKSAVLALLDANTGSFELDVPLGDGAGIRETGSYRIDPPAYAVVREASSPDGGLRIATRSVGDDTWYRLEAVTSSDGGEGWPCWLSHDDMVGLEGVPAEMVQVPPGQPPAALVAASYGVGQTRTDSDDYAGTADLAITLGLLGSKLLLATGVDPQGDATVPATFSVDGRTLSGFEVAISGLPDAIEASGGTLPAEVSDLGGFTGAIAASFSDVGQPIEVQPPPPGEVLRIDAGGDFEAAMAACGAG